MGQDMSFTSHELDSRSAWLPAKQSPEIVARSKVKSEAGLERWSTRRTWAFIVTVSVGLWAAIGAVGFLILT